MSAIVDLRIYTLPARGVPDYVKLFESHGLPVQLRHLGAPLGYYVTEIGPLNQVVHLWGFDSLADMEARRARRNADPDWAKYLDMSKGMVLAQENRILRRHEFKGI
jgi:hypothetical protein